VDPATKPRTTNCKFVFNGSLGQGGLGPLATIFHHVQYITPYGLRRRMDKYGCQRVYGFSTGLISRALLCALLDTNIPINTLQPCTCACLRISWAKHVLQARNSTSGSAIIAVRAEWPDCPPCLGQGPGRMPPPGVTNDQLGFGCETYTRFFLSDGYLGQEPARMSNCNPAPLSGGHGCGCAEEVLISNAHCTEFIHFGEPERGRPPFITVGRLSEPECKHCVGNS